MRLTALANDKRSLGSVFFFNDERNAIRVFLFSKFYSSQSLFRGSLSLILVILKFLALKVNISCAHLLLLHFGDGRRIISSAYHQNQISRSLDCWIVICFVPGCKSGLFINSLKLNSTSPTFLAHFLCQSLCFFCAPKINFNQLWKPANCIESEKQAHSC